MASPPELSKAGSDSNRARISYTTSYGSLWLPSAFLHVWEYMPLHKHCPVCHGIWYRWDLPAWKSHSYILSRYSVLLPLTELMGPVNWDIWRHLDDQVSRRGWRKDYQDLLKYSLAFGFCLLLLYSPIPGPRFHPWSPISGFTKVWKVILSWQGTHCLLPCQSWSCT